jgi:hypothetical protein
MKITLIDASNYFKGLLLLVGKDRKIADPENEMMQRIGKTFGFEKVFCDNAIRDILENKFILDVPPEFSEKELAKKFIRDGLTLAASDNEIHPSEEAWLLSTAEKNGLDAQWFYKERQSMERGSDIHGVLEVDGLTVEYS